MNKDPKTIIELIVNDHPGVMSHVTGLFARRAFNLDGILCGGMEDGARSRMYLLVNDDERLEQIIKQIEKLYDVLEVAVLKDSDHTIFHRLQEIVFRKIG